MNVHLLLSQVAHIKHCCQITACMVGIQCLERQYISTNSRNTAGFGVQAIPWGSLDPQHQAASAVQNSTAACGRACATAPYLHHRSLWDCLGSALCGPACQHVRSALRSAAFSALDVYA